MAKSETKAATIAAPTEPTPEPATIDRPEAEAPITHVRFVVRSSLESRRRAGRSFGQAPVTIEANTLTRAEAEAIATDPYLTAGPALDAD